MDNALISLGCSIIVIAGIRAYLGRRALVLLTLGWVVGAVGIFVNSSDIGVMSVVKSIILALAAAMVIWFSKWASRRNK